MRFVKILPNVQLFLYILIFNTLVYAQSSARESTIVSQFVEMKAADGTVSILSATADDDGDGIDNALELNGFIHSIQNGIQAWDGDSSKTFYITDPNRWSTDGDPYSDYMEVTGINMPSAISFPENHPLVAARPVITINMTSYDVIPLATITNTKGGEQNSSFTNEVSSSNTVSGSVTVGVELNPFKLASAEVTASYSHTWSNTQSSTSSFGSNWSDTRTTQPDQAAKLKLQVFMENIGGATALEVEPTINLKIGGKTIATFIPGQQANILTPPGTSDSRFPKSGNIVIEKDENNNDIVLTLDELKAIQMGAPISLEVVQVSAKVVRWNSNDQDWNSDVDWASFESEIDPVTVDIRAELGDGNNTRYQVFAGTPYWDPGFVFEDLISLIFDMEDSSNEVLIENRRYPDDWYLSSPSQVFLDEWKYAGQPQNLMGLKMNRNTKLVMLSPGGSPAPEINLATYSADYKNVMVSAIPINFPILEVTAQIPVAGETIQLNLIQDESSFYASLTDLEGIPEGPGQVTVKNARGDVSTATISLPAVYKDAKDVKEFSSFLPDPGAEYWIYPNGDDENPVLLYCLFFDPETHAELSIPREYLSIERDKGMLAYSDYVAYNDIYRFYFDKIRINPGTFNVVRNDLTFIQAENLTGGTEIPSYLYDYITLGNVLWSYPENDSGFAYISLKGTPFHFDVTTDFTLHADASTFIDKSRKTLSIKRNNLSAVSYEYYNSNGIVDDSLQLVRNYKAVPTAQKLNDGGKALHVNSTETTGYISMGSGESMRVTEALTIEARIYPSGPGGDELWGGSIINKEGEFEILRKKDGTIIWAISNSSPAWNWRSSHYMAPENQWLQLALVYDGQSVKTYFNGVLFHDYAGNGVIGDFYANLNELQLGGRQANGTQRFQGLIDEVRLWDTARNATQIKSTWNDTLDANLYNNPDSGLIGYWRLDNIEDLGDNGLVVRDLSINQNTGYIYGDVVLSDLPTKLIALSDKLPQEFTLNQNYPNPFNPATTIKYKLQHSDYITIKIFNTRGQLVKQLFKGSQEMGSHKLIWDGTNQIGQPVTSGIYFYRLSLNGKNAQTKKMMLVR